MQRGVTPALQRFAQPHQRGGLSFHAVDYLADSLELTVCYLCFLHSLSKVKDADRPLTVLVSKF